MEHYQGNQGNYHESFKRAVIASHDGMKDGHDQVKRWANDYLRE